MKDEKKFIIPEALVIYFEGDLDTLTPSGPDMGDPFDPEDPLFPGH